MGLFSKKDKAPEAAVAAVPVAAPAGKLDFSRPAKTTATGGLDLGKQSGKISLVKGARVTIEKSAVIKARATWDSNTDYDLYALVLLKSGEVLTVSTFGSNKQQVPTPSVLNGAVKHMGDVARGVKGVAEETIEIRMTDEIEAVFPIAYSAQSNGGGSFRRYKVALGLDNGAGTEVNIDAASASNNDSIFTVVIGVIRNTPNGIQVESLEEYSKPGSEKRPAIINGKIVVDAGATNLYK